MSTDRTGRDPRELASRLVKPRLSVVRKVQRQGNSLVIAPGVTFLHALGLLKGDYVELVLDEYAKRFWVRKVPRRQSADAREAVETLSLEKVL